MLGNISGGYINILARCRLIYHPCCRQGLTRDPVCAPSTLGQNANAVSSISTKGCTQLGTAECACVCVSCSTTGLHHQRGNAAIVLLERQYARRWRDRAHDCNFFLHECSPPPLSASVGLNYLSYIRRKKNAKGYKDNENGESLA